MRTYLYATHAEWQRHGFVTILVGLQHYYRPVILHL